jgi:hypothetical protein
VLALQAAHSPHAPVKPEPATKRTFSLGPLSTSTESAPVVEKVPATALPQPIAPKQVEAPKDKMHLMFVEGANMSKEEKRLFDLRELVEGAEVRGLTRAKWEGYRFSTGNECTQGYHAELMEVLKAANVVATKGKTYLMRVNTAQAIESMGLQAYDYR